MCDRSNRFFIYAWTIATLNKLNTNQHVLALQPASVLSRRVSTVYPANIFLTKDLRLNKITLFDISEVKHHYYPALRGIFMTCIMHWRVLSITFLIEVTLRRLLYYFPYLAYYSKELCASTHHRIIRYASVRIVTTCQRHS